MLLRRHLLAAPGLLLARGGDAPRTVLPAPENEASIIRTPDSTLRLFYMVKGQHVASISSSDSGETWTLPRVELPVSGPTAHACIALYDRTGSIHVFFLTIRGEGRRLAVDRFIDICHTRLAPGTASWLPPRVIYQGYVGSLRSAIQLKNGNIVLPFAAWQANRAPGPPFGSNEVTSLCSRDGGETWEVSASPLRAPCYDGYNGSNYGAVEPCVLELSDARLWMLIRTQTGQLYESLSPDGLQWQDARPSRFRSSNSPAALLRLRSGALLVVWNNCLPPPRYEGQGVYGGRDALHAAISTDDGTSWQGFREICLDPTRDETPPRTGDRATGYPYAVEAPDGHIVVATGQRERRRALIRFRPAWLLESQRSDDLARGLGAWSVFQSFGPASGYWRDRRPAARLVRSDDGAALSIAAGAIWNFPAAQRGRLEVALLRASGGGTLSLTDCFFDPDDSSGDRDAPFSWNLGELGLSEDAPVRMIVEWRQSSAVLSFGRNSHMIARRPTPNGLSYLRLRSVPAAADSGGLLVRSVAARRL